MPRQFRLRVIGALALHSLGFYIGCKTATSAGAGATTGTATSSGAGGTIGASATTASSGSQTTAASTSSGTAAVTTNSSSSSGTCANPCPAGEKPMVPSNADTADAWPGLSCVSATDPSYGCGATDASPCSTQNPNVHNAQWGCTNGMCTMTGCNAGFADCNSNPSDGCEADLKSLTTCGSCSVSCGASQVCTPSGCAASCPSPDAYCNGSCVDLQSTPDHCGSCTGFCANPPHGVAKCTNGMCTPQCETGYVPISGKCVNQSADPTCCGATCTSCAPPMGGEGQCQSGACTAVCPTGMAVCNSRCTDIQRDVDNCGGCGAPCGGLCSNGICDPNAKQIIATGHGVTELAADGTSVFWIDNGTDIMQVIRDGTSAPISLASAQQGAKSLVADASSVYWVNSSGGGIWRATKGMPGAILVAPQTNPSGVAVNSTDVFVFGGSTLPKTVAAPMLPWSTASRDFAVNDTSMCHINLLSGLVCSNLDGSNPATIHGSFSAFPWMALGPTRVIYTWGGDRTVWRRYCRTGRKQSARVGVVRRIRQHFRRPARH